MSGADYSPHVAWGLRAIALAMKAKCGSPRVTFADVLDLAQLQIATLPGDGDAALAVIRFLARFDDDPIAAGAALHHFLIEWRAAEIAVDADRIHAAVTEQCPELASVRVPPIHDWQIRADTGID